MNAPRLIVGLGNPTDQHAHDRHNAGFWFIDALLRHRDATKTLEFLRSWLELRDPTNVIHATYNVGFVKTGRLSSSNPNVQQISARLKPAFIPRPGHVLLDLDYSQVELRVAAFISRSQPMIEAFQRGDDLHRLLAAKIAGKAPEDVTSLERKRAKAGNFGLLYGMSPGGFQSYAATALRSRHCGIAN